MRRLGFVFILLLLSGCAVQRPNLTPAQSEALRARLGSGTLEPTCAVNCYGNFLINISSLNAMYQKGDWPSLTAAVMTIGHGNELSFYYLGQAAEHAGYPHAALMYYSRSVALSQSGVSGQRCGAFLGCPFPAGEQAQQRITALITAQSAPTKAAEQAIQNFNALAKQYGVTAQPPRMFGRQTGAVNAPTSSGQSGGNAAPSSAMVSNVSGDVTENELLNCTFRDENYERDVHLRNGRWDESKDDPTGQSSSLLYWQITNTAIIDLNGDGILDGVFIAITDNGTMASRENYLYIVLGGVHEHHVLKGLMLGERDFRPKSLFIKDKTIHVTADVARADQRDVEDPKGHEEFEFILSGHIIKEIQLPVQKPLSKPVVATAAASSNKESAMRKEILNIALPNMHFKNGRASATLVDIISRETARSINTITHIAVDDPKLNGTVTAAFANVRAIPQDPEAPESAELYAVTFRQHKKPQVIDFRDLGINTSVTELSIRNGIIHVTKLVPISKRIGTKRVQLKQRFKIKDGVLELIDEK